MAFVKVYDKQGNAHEREFVDAKEMVREGPKGEASEYTLTPPVGDPEPPHQDAETRSAAQNRGGSEYERLMTPAKEVKEAAKDKAQGEKQMAKESEVQFRKAK